MVYDIRPTHKVHDPLSVTPKHLELISHESPIQTSMLLSEGSNKTEDGVSLITRNCKARASRNCSRTASKIEE